MRALALSWLVLLAAPAAHAADAPVVVLDPGHDLRANLATEPIGPGSGVRKIMDGGGTHGVVSGLSEAELNLRVSFLLRDLLERSGIRVAMTRTRTVGAGMGNIARARIANRARAALFLRVHADGSTDAAQRGTHTLVPALRIGWTDDVRAASLRAARLVQRELVRSLGLPDRGVGERSDYTGFNWSDVPVILVELGFMTNRVDDRVLGSPRGRRRAAIGLCRGTLRFLGRSVGPCGT